MTNDIVTDNTDNIIEVTPEESSGFYITLDEEGYLTAFANSPAVDGIQEPVELPEDLNDGNWTSYKYEDGVLVLDEERLAQNNALLPIPTQEERLAALESAMLEMIMGGVPLD